MTITATELKKNLGKYLELAQKEEIVISKNGKESLVLCRKESEAFRHLDGLLKGFSYSDDDINERELKWERLKNV